MVKRGIQKMSAVTALALVLAIGPTDGDNGGGEDFTLELRGQAVEIVPLRDLMAFGSAGHDPPCLGSARHAVRSTIGASGSIVHGRLEFVSRGVPSSASHTFGIGQWFDMIGKRVSNVSDKAAEIVYLGLLVEPPLHGGIPVQGRIVMDDFAGSVYRVAIPVFVDRPVSLYVFDDRTFREYQALGFGRGWSVLVFEYRLDDEGEVLDVGVHAFDPGDPTLEAFQFVVWWNRTQNSSP
ncbi:MAG: hypothetical protein FWB79_01165 [Treponema sp.]|nr:hypothetical protein [Treponema sp.]